jgi:hypothetical protein
MPSNGLLTNKYNDRLQAGSIKAQEILSDSIVSNNIRSNNINDNSIQFHSKDETKKPIKLYRDGNNIIVEFDDDDLSKNNFSKKNGVGDSKTDLERLNDGNKRYTTVYLKDNNGRQLRVQGLATFTTE